MDVYRSTSFEEEHREQQQWTRGDDEASRRQRRWSSSSSKGPAFSSSLEMTPRTMPPAPPSLPPAARHLSHSSSESQRSQDYIVENGMLSPNGLARRLQDFDFARHKRAQLYGAATGDATQAFGIVALFDCLSGIRTDLEWAEETSIRRIQGLPYLSWRDFDYEKNNHFGRNFPFFTFFVVITCTVTVIISFKLQGWTVEPMVENPMFGPSASTLLTLGAKYEPLVVSGEWWRLISACFLHGGVIHYVFNMGILIWIGQAVEKTHGSLQLFLVFFLSGYFGNIVSCIFVPDVVTVGASGAIFGVLGFIVADISINWSLIVAEIGASDHHRRGHCMVVFWLILDLLLNVLIGLTPYVDNFNHLGGLTLGFTFGVAHMQRISFRSFFGLERTCFGLFIALLIRFWGTILCAFLLLGSTAFLFDPNFDGVNCVNCRYMSCVPFPPWTGTKFWYCDDCDAHAEAEAAYDEERGYYEIDMTCPNGELVVILPDHPTHDLKKLSKSIPTLCRQQCQSTSA